MATYKKPCLQCGAMVEGGARICPFCGSESPFGYHCPSCLREIMKDMHICPGCGRILYITCAACGGAAFAGSERCDRCGATLMVVCPNPRCGARQFFQNVKCTACGKKLPERRQI